MYALASSEKRYRGSSVMNAENELRAILALRERALASRDLLYCSPVVKHLIEEEIPRLVARVGLAKV